MRLTGQELVHYLNGFLCVYKHRDVSLPSIKKLLMKRISSTINSLEPLPVPYIERPIVEDHPKSGAPVVVGMRRQLDYTLHPLCGATVRNEDFLFDEVEPMETSTSGVCLFAVNEGCEKLELVRDSGWVNQYVVNGVLGEETNKNMIRSKSEEAFEIAQSGAARPKVLGTPIIYDVQTLQFEPPRFQLKIICTNENDYFLRSLVHEIGCSLDTVARPTRLQRIQFGPFLRSHALLDKYFQLPSIVKNIQMCNKIISTELEATTGSRFLKTMDKTESLSYIKEYFLQHENLQQDFNSAIEEGLENGDAIRIPWGRSYE